EHERRRASPADRAQCQPAVDAGLREMKETIDRFTDMAYLQKDWLTLDEARYADITTATLREWRHEGFPEAGG
ncbi:MAG: hypothetical protein R6T83_09145, partial [Salinibacter sp.]